MVWQVEGHWFGYVTISSVPDIVDLHILQGQLLVSLCKWLMAFLPLILLPIQGNVTIRLSSVVGLMISNVMMVRERTNGRKRVRFGGYREGSM